MVTAGNPRVPSAIPDPAPRTNRVLRDTVGMRLSRMRWHGRYPSPITNVGYGSQRPPCPIPVIAVTRARASSDAQPLAVPALNQKRPISPTKSSVSEAVAKPSCISLAFHDPSPPLEAADFPALRLAHRFECRAAEWGGPAPPGLPPPPPRSPDPPPPPPPAPPPSLRRSAIAIFAFSTALAVRPSPSNRAVAEPAFPLVDSRATGAGRGAAGYRRTAGA